MITLNVHEIKAHFSRYLDLLEAGETIIICRRNKPIAEMRPLSPSPKPRPIGLGQGMARLDEGFFDPLPEERADASPCNSNVGMKVDIVAIGNSRGIRIPSMLLKQCGLTDQVELTIEDGRIILERPKARSGWSEAFAAMAETGDDALLLPEHPLSSFDTDEWTW